MEFNTDFRIKVLLLCLFKVLTHKYLMAIDSSLKYPKKFNSTMIPLVFFVIFNFLSINAATEEVSFYPLKFQSTNVSLGNNPKSFQDSTWISFDSSSFKPLLFTTSKIEIDTNNKNIFKISGPFVLNAKVGDGNYQSLWQYDSNKVVSVNISELISDIGLDISKGGQRILVDGFFHEATRLFLNNKPQPDSSNNSYISINSTVYVPETADNVKYKLPDSIKVKILESGNSVASFIGNVDTSFFIRNSGYIGKGLNLKYDANTKLYSLFGKIIYVLDSNFIPCNVGDSVKPGITYKNGKVDNINLIANDTFRLFGMKIHPSSFNVKYNSIDSTFKIFGKIGAEIEQSLISVVLGDSITPGCIAKNNNILSFRAGLVDTFSIRNFTFRPHQITFAYDSTTSNRFYLFGSITALLMADSVNVRDSIEAGLGTEANPGFEIINGQLTQFNLSVSKTFKLKNIQLMPDNVGISYVKATQNYSLFGALGVKFDSTEYKVNAGTIDNPGINIYKGKLTKLNVAIDDTINIRGFQIKPNQLTFKYDTTSNRTFYIFGSAVVLMKADSVNMKDSIVCSLGTESSPGFVIENGLVQSINFSVGGKFELKKLKLEPDGFTFKYDRNSKLFEMYGNLKASIDSMNFRGNFGTDSDPGIIFSGNKLIHLSFAINDTFQIRKLKIKPDTLTFVYDTTSHFTFKIFGNANAMLMGDSTNSIDTIKVKLGTVDQPGIIVSNGKLQTLNFGVTTGFMIKKLYIKPDNLTFKYDRDAQQYEMFGRVRLALEKDTLSVSLGNDSIPGIIINNQKLQSMNIALDDTVRIKSNVFIPRGLTFQYDEQKKYYVLFGGLTTIIEGDTIAGNLGDSANPGFYYQNGQIQKMKIGINTKFSLKRITFEAKDLTYQYDRVSNYYEIFGGVNISFDSTKMEVNLGTDSLPGIVISNGNLTQLNIGVTDTFSIRTLTFAPTKLSFIYDKPSQTYKIFGDISVLLKTDTIHSSLGTIDKPGISIKDGILQSINIGLTSDFKLFGLEFHPKNLTFEYDKKSKLYKMYGDLNTVFEKDTVNANLGNESNPGILIQNSQVQQIIFGLTSDIKIGGLELNTNGLTFHYDKNNSYYEMYGSVGFNLEGEAITANLGVDSNPGLIIQNGNLKQLNIGITSDIKFGGFEVSTNNAGVSYVKGNPSKYVIFGTLNFKELWNISTTLGDPNQPGTGLELLVNNGHTKVILDDFSFEAKHVDFGGINFNDILVKYSQNGNNYAVDVDVDVAFPAGFEIAGVVAFEEIDGKFRLDSIDLDFEAAGANPGIEIPETGIFIVGLNGGVNRLGNSNDFQFKGGIALTLGGQISIAGNSYELLRIEGEATIDKNHLELTDRIYLAAMKKDGKWTSYLGEGEVDLNLNWNEGTYVVKGGIYLLNDGDEKYVDFTAEAYYYSTGTFGALGEADLFVPQQIPIIGGKHLASVDAALRYNKHDLDHSFAAGWVSLGSKIRAGIEYNFGTKDVKSIGSNDIDNLQKDVESDEAADNIHYNFTVAENVNALTISIKPANPNDYIYLMTLMKMGSPAFTLTTPTPLFTNYLDLSEIIVQSFDKNGSGTYETSYYEITVDSVKCNGIALHFSGTSKDPNELIPTGQYYLHTVFPKSSSGLFDLEIQQHYIQPDGKLKAKYNEDSKMIDIESQANLYVNNKATITFYQNTEQKYNGTVIKSIDLAGSANGTENITTNYSYPPFRDSVIVSYDSTQNKLIKSTVQRPQKYYLYAVINDGNNSPVYTDFSNSITIEPEFKLNIEPQNTRIKKVGNKIKGIADIGLSLEYDDNLKSSYSISFFYDNDQVGNNGYPIANLQNLTIDELENPDSVYSFIYDDLTKVGSGTTYYLYAKVVKINSNNSPIIYTDYSSAVTFNPILTVNVNYNSNSFAPASGQSVWLDMNNNGIYDSGIDQIKVTDVNGKCGFFVTEDGKYATGINLTGNFLSENSKLSNKTIQIDIHKNNYLTYNLNHQPIVITGTYSIKGVNSNVNLNKFTQFGTNNNYIFADYNMNGVWDSSIEPRVINDASGNIKLTVLQPIFNLVYVDNLTLQNVANTLNFRLTDAEWSINGNYINTNSIIPYWSVPIDVRTKDGSTNQIKCKFQGKCLNF